MKLWCSNFDATERDFLFLKAYSSETRLWFLVTSGCCRSTPKFRASHFINFCPNVNWSSVIIYFYSTFSLIISNRTLVLRWLFLYDIILGCAYNENYSHSTDYLDSSKYYGYDVNLCKASNYLNPTYNSKINLCINDDYISIGNHESYNNRNPSGFRHKRESKFFDENMNCATPLINNAHESKICKLNGFLPGKSCW